MERSDTSPADFLASLPDDVRPDMSRLHDLISHAMGHPPVTLWEGVFWGGSEQSILGYGEITQPRPTGPDVEWFAVGLARQRDHFSLYVNAVDDGAYLGKQYEGRLGKAKVGAAAITFRSVDGLDLESLTELLGRAAELSGL